MAGNNKILEPGSILFREGDESNGMYVIRRGKILIYLDKGGNEIPLVTVGEGAMVGEMALFDKKPRSASARAVEQVEVTVISNQDFTKILKQIPKWFVTLMTTLSSRLRDTNGRLEEMEANYKSNYNPLDELNKVLHILNLLWYKLGNKEVKSWSMEKDVAEQEIAMILGLSIERVVKTIQALIHSGLIGQGKDTYKKDTLTIQNRGSIDRFIRFVTSFRAKDKTLKVFPQKMVDMIEVMARLTSKSAYDAVNIPFDELVMEGDSMGLRTQTWAKHVSLFKDLDEAITLVNVADNNHAFKINKKHIGRLQMHAKLLHTITNMPAQTATPAKPKKKKARKKVA